VEYFFYCRDNPGTGPPLDELAEAPWSFMDEYADAMIAPGPTLTPDRTTHTGSMHMVDLPEGDAVRVFAFEEPYYKAGVYGDVLIRRLRNEFGRTVWDFRSLAQDDPRFLIIGLGRPGVAASAAAMHEDHLRYLANEYEERIIQRGPLLADDGTEWVSSAMLVELPGRSAVDAMMSGEPFVTAGLYSSVEIHDWKFGGRP
jgi:uncharacterized protein